MTVPPPESPVLPAVAAASAAVAVAQAHQAAQTALTDATLAAVLAIWAKADPTAWFDSWWRQRLGQQVFVLVSLAQESAASEAHPYVRTVLDLLGTPADIPDLAPETFAGIASDGTSLEALLSFAPVISYARTQRGWEDARAREAGANFLREVVTTQIQDAGRAADQVAISVAVPQQTPSSKGGFRARGKKSTYNLQSQVGYVRMLTPPSCARCIVLAGKVYRWNEGFLRHPCCDCRHLPVVVANAEDFTADPMKYFDNLSEREQDDVFGRANAQAIRDGADMSRVVNAAASGHTWVADNGRRYTKVGVTRYRGGQKKRAVPVLRPTPWQIYRDARGSKDEALRLLREFGYILR